MDDGLGKYGDSKRKAHIRKNCHAVAIELKKTNKPKRRGTRGFESPPLII
jgi:hypothetical protein